MTKSFGHNKAVAITKKKSTRRRPTATVSYPIGTAKARLSEIVDSVAVTGAEVVLTRHGRPVARLVPERGSGPRPLGFAKGRVKLKPGWDAPLTAEELLGD